MLLAKQTLSLALAKHLALAAEQNANEASLGVVIAVVDDGGNLLYLGRMENAPLGSVEVAHRKAKSAVMFKAETKDFEKGLAAGVQGLLSLDLIPFEGGVPLRVDGAIIGAIGVSGGTAAQDGTIARAGAAALGDMVPSQAAARPS